MENNNRLWRLKQLLFSLLELIRLSVFRALQPYYLGPNYNLSFNVAGYYMCHEDFWKRIDRKEIIERTFQLATYWVKNDGQLNSYEFMPFAAELSLNGVAQSDKMNNLGKHYFIPWLKAPAWQ